MRELETGSKRGIKLNREVQGKATKMKGNLPQEKYHLMCKVLFTPQYSVANM